MHTHGTVRNGKRLVWYMERLWPLAADLEVFELDVASVKELDQNCWFKPGREPTLRAVAEHCRRINDASFDFPVILNDDGSLMDGGHRLCRALLEGRHTVPAVRFASMPEPHEVHDSS